MPLAPLLAQTSDSASPEDGPIELPFSTPSFISTDDEPSTLQVATNILLTDAISIFLFCSLHRRAKRAKELGPFLPPTSEPNQPPIPPIPTSPSSKPRFYNALE